MENAGHRRPVWSKFATTFAIIVLAGTLTSCGGGTSCKADDSQENTATSWSGCVSTGKVFTGIEVPPRSEITVTAEGRIDFGGGFLFWGPPVLDPNGDGTDAPDDYPAPDLDRNSLICEVGGSQYQCGDKYKFNPPERAELILYVNDLNRGDNEGAWTVTVTVNVEEQDDDQIPVPDVTRRYEQFPVVDHVVQTGLKIEQGSTVITDAKGLLNFGCPVSGCVYDADGLTDTPAGSGFLEPRLDRFSLVFGVGGHWYQGGVHERNVISETGLLRVGPNDSELQIRDNAAGWTVSITVVPPGGSEEFDPTSWAKVGSVTDQKVTGSTGQDTIIRQGEAIKVDARGTINVRPWLAQPNGEGTPAPREFPAPGLSKYSLVLQIGDFFYQGGADEWVVPFAPGKLTLWVNDEVPGDNVGAGETPEGWIVSYTIYEPPEAE
jgi:hypothetical protein